MRILHSKAITDPILLVSACHNMNLFAVVTSTTVTVYRSTTLTVVATLPLSTGYINEIITSSKELRCAQEMIYKKIPDSEARGSSLGASIRTPPNNEYKQNVVPFITDGMAAWSPSGRLFTFALPCGVVLLLDVESSDLVRVFIPKSSQKASVAKRTHENLTSSSRLRHGPLDVDGRIRNTLNGVSHAEAPSIILFEGVSHAEAGRGEPSEGGNPTEEKHSHTSSTALSEPAVISISTAVGPIAALSWITVPYSQRRSCDLSFCTNGIYAECLSLQPDLSSSLLDEVETSFAQKGDPTSAEGDTRRAVAILMILDMAGGLSFVVGGLQEVRFIRIGMPYSLGNGIHVEKLITVPVQETHPQLTNLEVDLQCEEGDDEQEIETHSAARTAQIPRDSFFFSLTSHSLLSLSNQLEQYRGKNLMEEAHITLEKWVHRSVRYSHRVYLLVKPTSASNSNYNSSASTARRELFEIDLGLLLTRMVDTRTAMICCIAEYCRMAEICMQSQQQLWRSVLENGTRKHLNLPSKALLLRDVVVERLTQPNLANLMAYYANIDKFALVEDLEKLSKTLRHVVKVVERTCYRCYDASISLLSTFADCNTALNQNTYEGKVQPPKEGFYTPSRLSMRDLSAEVIEIIGDLRRCAETFLRGVQVEMSYEQDLLHYVLHRSSLLLTPSATSSRERHKYFSAAAMVNAKGKATLMNFSTEPLAVERHPTLLRTLERIYSGKNTLISPHSPMSDVVDDFTKWSRSLERLIRCMLNQRSQEEEDLRLLNQAYKREDRVEAQRIEGIAYNRATEACFIDFFEPHVTVSEEVDSNKETDLQSNEEKEYPASFPHLFVKVVVVSAPSLENQALLKGACGGIYNGNLSINRHSLIGQTPFFNSSANTVSLQAPSMGSIQVSSNKLIPVWYGYLREDRHLFVYIPMNANRKMNPSSTASAERESSSDVMVVTFNDDMGNPVVYEAREEEEKEEESLIREWGVRNINSNNPEESNVGVEVSGMPINGSTIRATMSRAREFFVVAANNRFVVFDLYDD
ncbi:unnamed protein product [Phytomonas sp. Hart1]|nr:unnamed protein product [Phytomonas sp. Hart1]|eukprot:CCW66036.1 unnamed protein product [Phytomonas sp. isolate Hart1]